MLNFKIKKKKGNFAIDRVGMVYDRLTVLRRAEKVGKEGQIYWECQCSCGGQVTASVTTLTGNKKVSCGCIRREHMSTLAMKKIGPKGQAGLTKLYLTYKSIAKRKKLSFELDKEQFKTLTSQNCHYCGIPPKYEMHSYSQITPEVTANGLYTYNGIDRVNSKQGYFKENCVSCCAMCNRAKFNKPSEELLVWLENIIHYQRSKSYQEAYNSI